MKTTRKRYSGEFKAKVVLEALRGDLTLAELAAKHGVHHTMIAAWKRQVINGLAGVFDGAADSARAASEADIPMRRGFLYLVAIMDWATRKVLAWRLSNSEPGPPLVQGPRRADASFCVLALEEALARHGRPEMLSPYGRCLRPNTDQGSQFTWRCVHGRPAGRRHPHQHGRAWPLDGQCVHRAALAVAEIRMRLPACLRDRLGAARRADPLDRLLQRPPATLGACRPHPA
jgi:transposase